MGRTEDSGWYRSQDVRRVCGISQRTLDYWSESGCVSPSRRESVAGARNFRLFSFKDLLRVRFIKTLRDAGFSLRKIRWTLDRLTPHQRLAPWSYVVSDGRSLFRRTEDPALLESLMRREQPQLAFAVLLLGQIEEAVRRDLKRGRISPFDASRIRGKTLPPRRIAAP